MKSTALRAIAPLILCLFGGCALTPTVTSVPIEERTAETRGAPPAGEIPRLRDDPGARQGESEPGVVHTEVANRAATPAAISRLEVVRVLATQAETIAAGGDLTLAGATLERALRIEPANPWLWHRLALVRFEQGDYELAQASAERSDTLAGDWGEAIRRANLRLLERIAAPR